MKVKNETNYDTRYLRKLFMDCERHEGTNPKHRYVRVINKRGGGVAGCAWLNSYSVTMKLPTYQAPKAASVAQVYIHEVGHNLGLRHKEMASYSSIDVSWLLDEDVPLKKIKPPKPRPNIVEIRTAKAQKKLDEHLKKLKREQNLVKKYRIKVRYYEKKIAASPKKSP